MKKVILLFCVTFITGCLSDQNNTTDINTNLNGTWLVTTIDDTPVIADSMATLVFNTDELRLSGSTGCNLVNTGYKLDNDMIELGMAATTLKMCPPALMEQEQRFIKALEKVARLSITNDLLILQDNADNELFRATKQP